MTNLPPDQIISKGKSVLLQESAALNEAASRLDSAFAQAVALIARAPGKVICCGLGKSGHIARKVAATFASTGTPAFFLHPAEALHGDLGMLGDHDCLLAIAYGGETMEVLEVCKFARRRGIASIAITGRPESTLAGLVDVVIDASVSQEACPHNLAPTNSSTVAIALGDAMAVALMAARGFSQSDFASYHPAGSLGRRLAKVSDVMRGLDELRPITADSSFTAVLEGITRPNFGIVAVVNHGGELLGSITDGDVRRALGEFKEHALNKSACDLMTHAPKVIGPDALAVDAVAKMEAHKITSLFVVPGQVRRLLGLIRMQDLLEKKII